MAQEIQPLIDSCLAGEESAAEQFVARFQQRVFGLCWRILGHRHDAEDAAQETFVRALRGLSTWDNKRPIEPWLLAIAANRCRTALARRRNKPAGLPLLDHDLSTIDHLQPASQLAEEVYRALARLNENHATAFRLFHEEELSYADIASALECPLGTAKTWVHRARRDIVAELVKRDVLENPLEKKNEPLQTKRNKIESVA